MKLGPDTKLADAFCADRGGTTAGAATPIYLARNVKVIGHEKDARHTIKQHVVLGKAVERRRHDSEADISENIGSCVLSSGLSEMFLYQELGEDIDLICADPFCLVSVGHL